MMDENKEGLPDPQSGKEDLVCFPCFR